MEAVGSEVYIAILPLITGIIFTVIYFKQSFKKLYYQIFGHPEQQRLDPVQQHPIFGVGECSICLISPKKLQVSATCGHSFCGQCLLSIYERERNKIFCPLCRRYITTIFKSFPNQQATDQQRIRMQQRIHHYNQRFDDNRPWIRRVSQLPYVVRRMLVIFSPMLVGLFLMSLYFFRDVLIIVAQLAMPLDIFPQKFFDFLRLLDDLFFGIVYLLFASSMFALVFIRNRV